MRIITLIRRGGLLLAGCLAMFWLGGCASQNSANLKPIQAAYFAGDYRSAYVQAHAISDSPVQRPAVRQEAAYLAGLSANWLNDLDNAQQELAYAAQSKDPALAADAQATLGLVYTQQGRYGLAADALLDAAEHLQGQDRANAYYYGGIAQQKMGRWPQARNNLSLAISNSRDPDFRAKAIAQLKITGYTLQTGAYEVQDHARNAANTMADRMASMHMGRPRIVPSHDPGSNRRLYLVQVGEFSSWPTALAARDQLGLSTSVVVPLSMR